MPFHGTLDVIFDGSSSCCFASDMYFNIYVSVLSCGMEIPQRIVIMMIE
jgi:hypothetical protein